ncbi:MAG: radical SAM protein [Phycisphaeraceae bacterium]
MSSPTTLVLSEIFYSVQGESTWAGLPCVFVRLAGCHLRCAYCDTEYAFRGGTRRTLDDIMGEIDRVSGGEGRLVEITGGEPLLQPGVFELMTRLCDRGRTVLVETSGACDIGPCDERVIRIVDLKTPGSGESDRTRWANLDLLRPADEIKFVLTDRADYEWARQVIRQRGLVEKLGAGHLLMSAAAAMPASREIAGAPGLAIRDLAAWILEDRLPVRLQTQLHKLIWDPMARGV